MTRRPDLRAPSRLAALWRVVSHPNSVAALGCYTTLALALTALLGVQAFWLVGLLFALDVTLTHAGRG